MNDTVSEDVKPCPFCGEVNVTIIERTCDRATPYNPADYAYPRVVCKCGAEVPGENWGHKRTALAAWNRRAYLAATKPPLAGDVTDAIAQIIDPHSFIPDNSGDDLTAEMVRQGKELALSKAARILSALGSPPMPGRTCEETIAAMSVELERHHAFADDHVQSLVWATRLFAASRPKENTQQ